MYSNNRQLLFCQMFLLQGDRVYTKIILQAPRIGEYLISILGRMLYLCSVNCNVFLQGSIIGESLVTFLAGIWFLPCVDPNVTLQVARLRKCFVTFLAGIWFLPCVDPNVILQVARLRKLFCHIPCRNMVSPQCGSSCVFSGL